jgi:hypothetical protein
MKNVRYQDKFDGVACLSAITRDGTTEMFLRGNLPDSVTGTEMAESNPNLSRHKTNYISRLIPTYSG